MWSSKAQQVNNSEGPIEAGSFHIIHGQRDINLENICQIAGNKLSEWIKYLTGEMTPPAYEGSMDGKYWANKLRSTPTVQERISIDHNQLVELITNISSNNEFFKRISVARNLDERVRMGVIAVTLARQFFRDPSFTIDDMRNWEKNFDWTFCAKLARYVFYTRESQAVLTDSSSKVIMPSFRFVTRSLASSFAWRIFDFEEASQVVKYLNLQGFAERLLQFSRNGIDKGDRGKDRHVGIFRFLSQPRELTAQAERRYLQQFEVQLRNFLVQHFSDPSDQSAIMSCNVDCLARMSLILTLKSKAPQALETLDAEKLAKQVLRRLQRDLRDALLLVTSDYEGIFGFIQRQTKGRKLLVPGDVRRAFRNERARILASALLGFSDPFLNSTVEREPQGFREKINHWKKLARKAYERIFETRPKIPLD